MEVQFVAPSNGASWTSRRTSELRGDQRLLLLRRLQTLPLLQATHQFQPPPPLHTTNRVTRWTTCALSGQPLAAPVVACGLGRLYSKASVLEFLLAKKSGHFEGQQGEAGAGGWRWALGKEAGVER